MARAGALAAAIAVSLLAVSGAGGAATQQTPKRGGTVVVAADAEPACIAVYVGTCLGGDLLTHMAWLPAMVLPGAFEMGSDLIRRPKLVSHVDVTTSAPFALTYHIRSQARWSDGRPVTARDFVFTFETVRRYADQILSFERANFDRVRSVNAVDRKTVRVVLRSRWAGWPLLFSAVLPRHVLAGENYPEVWKDRIHDPKTSRPIGSGPFLVAGWERGRRLTLVRNPRYWGKHTAYLDRLVFFFDASSDPIAALSRGEVDHVWGLSPDSIPSLRAISGVTVRTGSAPALEHFGIRVGPGGNLVLRRSKLARRALAYGIDRQAIVRELYGAAAPSQRLADNMFFMNASPYYRPNWSRYHYRPDQARRLLEQAGCRRGADGIYSCEGQRLSLRFYARADRAHRVRAVELAQAQLRRVGIEVVPTFTSGNTLVNQVLPSGNFDVVTLAFFWAPPDENVPYYLRCGASDYIGYCQRLVDADLDQADRILDTDRRAAVLNRADTQVARDVPVIPLYWGPLVAATARSVHGYVFHPSQPFWGAENWWLAD